MILFSLFILLVRRSSSKRGNLLSKQHSQPKLESTSKFAYQYHQRHKHSFKSEGYTSEQQHSINDDTEQFELADEQDLRPILRNCCDCHRSDDTITGDTQIDTDKCAVVEDFGINKMQSASVPSSMSRISSSNESQSSAGADSSNVADLATENLPAVDTPDACDKAALRLVFSFLPYLLFDFICRLKIKLLCGNSIAIFKQFDEFSTLIKTMKTH